MAFFEILVPKTRFYKKAFLRKQFFELFFEKITLNYLKNYIFLINLIRAIDWRAIYEGLSKKKFILIFTRRGDPYQKNLEILFVLEICKFVH